MEKQRTNYIDIAKGIAIILVVYGHAAAQLKGTSFYVEHLQIQNKIIFSFVMPIFFMISGSFQRKRLDSPNFDHKIYLTKISQSILLPFYSLSIVFLLINLSLSNLTNTPPLGDMIYAILLQQSNGDLLPSGVLWFLFTLFSFSIITYFSIKILNINLFILIVISIILRFDFNIYQYSYYFSFDKISNYFIYYLFGYSFYNVILKHPIYKLRHLFLISICYALLLLVSSKEILNLSFLPFLVGAIGLCGILGSLLVLGIAYNISAKFNQNLLIKIITYYGAYSILIYVFHMPTFTIFKKIATFINLDPSYTKQFILFFPGIVLAQPELV